MKYIDKFRNANLKLFIFNQIIFCVFRNHIINFCDAFFEINEYTRRRDSNMLNRIIPDELYEYCKTATTD